jgi:hypothetical protein
VTQITEYGLAVTPGGISNIAVSAASATNFGSGEDEESLLLGEQTNAYLVQFDASGKVLFRETDQSIGAPISSLVTNASGFLWTEGSPSSLFALVQSPSPVMTGVTASGAYSWQQSNSTQPVLAAGPNGAVGFDTSGATNALETLQAFASDGSSPWTTSTPFTGSPEGGGLAVDANGEPLLVGGFEGTVTFGSTPPLTSAGGEDIDYQLFDTSGHLTSAGKWGGPDNDSAGGIGVDPAGNILFAGSSSPPTVDSTSRVFFVKIAR